MGGNAGFSGSGGRGGSRMIWDDWTLSGCFVCLKEAGFEGR